MAFKMNFALDDTDWKLLDALQSDARLSYTALGKHIGLTRPAVVERIRRLEEAGVIKGYHAQVDPAKLGLGITAFIRMSLIADDEIDALVAMLTTMPEVQECYRGTGPDCFNMRVVVPSIVQLDGVLKRLSKYGNPTSSVVLADVVTRRNVQRTAGSAY